MALSRITNGGVASSGLPSGSIIQVRKTQVTTDSTLPLSAQTDTVVTGFTVNITPTSTSSIIKCEAMWMGEFGDDDPNSFDHMFFFYRDTTKLGYTGTAGNRNYGVAPATRTYFAEDQNSTPETAYLSFFDSPSTTSQITYTLLAGPWGGNNSTTFEINRSRGDGERGGAQITLWEISG